MIWFLENEGLYKIINFSMWLKNKIMCDVVNLYWINDFILYRERGLSIMWFFRV